MDQQIDDSPTPDGFVDVEVSPTPDGFVDVEVEVV